MEKCATIYDVLSEESFKVSSGGRNVIAQQYSKVNYKRLFIFILFFFRTETFCIWVVVTQIYHF